MIKNERMQVAGQKQLAPSIYEMTLMGELASEMKQPGQFVHLKAGGLDTLLRRPISISSIVPEKKQFTMIYRADGKGTARLAAKKTGDTVDVLGPLGNGFPLDEAEAGETVILAGGGIGVPPLYELSKQLSKRGVHVIHILGFQSKQAVFYEKEFQELGETIITTADGSWGVRGFVTDAINGLSSPFTSIYACGPTMMLRALEQAYGTDKKVFLSLEERMGCGIGACFACVCHTAADPEGISYKKVCTDGPVFRAGEVVI